MELTNSPTAVSITEKKQQVDAAALQAFEQLLLGARALEHVGLQAQPFRELVLEDEVGLALVADVLLHPHVEVLSELLTDGEEALRLFLYLDAVHAYERLLDKYAKDPMAEAAQFQIGYAYKEESSRSEYDQNAANQSIASGQPVTIADLL